MLLSLIAYTFLIVTVVGQLSTGNENATKMHCSDYDQCELCLNGHDFMKNPCEWCDLDNQCHPQFNLCPIPLRAQFLFNCPRSEEALPKYNETFARKYALPMIASIYASNDSTRDLCLKNHFDKIVTTSNYTIPCGINNWTECLSIIAYLPEENALVILYRSATDMHIHSRHFNFIFHSNMIDWPSIGGALSDIYHDAFRRLWGLMRDDLYDALSSNNTTQVWLFGHSFGGGLASIASTAIAAEGLANSDRIKLYTFGQPRITDAKCAQRHDELVPHSFRIINSNDILPSLPPRVLPGQQKGPFHHRHEVWYPHGMHRGSRYLLASMAEDGRASNSLVNLSLLDNIMMFDKNLLEWWKVGCK